MKLPALRLRTALLAIVLGVSLVNRLTPGRVETHAFAVKIFGESDLHWARNHLMHQLLYEAEQIQKGDFSQLSDNGAGRIYCEDPRAILYTLWDDLPEVEKEHALKVLGYPPNTTWLQLFVGPHPRWFSNSGIYWRDATLYWCGC